jgi:MFS family permease
LAGNGAQRIKDYAFEPSAMTKQIQAIAAILLSVLIFLIGNGLLQTLIPVRADLEGFSDVAIGTIGSAYYAGFALGCVYASSLLIRIGHIRTFAVAGGIAAATTLLQSLVVNALLWGVARFLFGISAACIYMVVESWLNDRSTNETRGRILGAYLTVNFGGLVIGQWLYIAAPPASFMLFNICAIFYALCLLPVGLTRLAQPHTVAAPPLRLSGLFQIAPVGVAGCVAVGVVNGAIWALAPVYAHDHGFSNIMVALFMSAFTAAGALIQVPAGRLSDRMDRRYIIAGMSFLAGAAGLTLVLIGTRNTSLAILLFAVYGAATLPIYGLSVAHTNDRVPREDFVATAAALLLLNGAASVIGPIFVALITTRTNSAALFAFVAAVHLLHTVFVLWRIGVVQSPVEAFREPYAPVSHQTSPVALGLDPRAPDTDQSDASVTSQ